MSDRDERLQAAALSRLLRLNAALHGIVTGLLFGAVIFAATNWLVLKGGPVVGPHLVLLAEFFPGYRVTFLGSFIGFGYGLLLGFAVGFAIAWVYNRLLDLRDAGGRRRS